MNVYVNPFIGSDTTDLDSNTGSDTAWFLIHQKSAALKHIWEVRPAYKTYEDDDADAIYTKVYFACQSFWTGWYGFWGSKGDGAAYSS